jgi:hypothetical protein
MTEDEARLVQEYRKLKSNTQGFKLEVMGSYQTRGWVLSIRPQPYYQVVSEPPFDVTE